MSYYDDDYGYEMEAIETERFDADLEMAEATATTGPTSIGAT